MRSLREDEIDDIESVSHLIKHVLSRRNVEGFRIWEAVLEMDRIGKKYILNEIITEEELSEILDLDDLKELMTKLFSNIRNHVETGDIN